MNIDGIRKEINEAKDLYIDYSLLIDELWTYHPANPDFVNPIKMYDELKGKLKDLECKINSLEREINSLN